MSWQPYKKGDWEREAILNSILDDSWSRKDVFHCVINVGQETFLETGIYNIIVVEEVFQLESQDFVEEFAYCHSYSV